jgi:hypothetical protein
VRDVRLRPALLAMAEAQRAQADALAALAEAMDSSELGATPTPPPDDLLGSGSPSEHRKS